MAFPVSEMDRTSRIGAGNAGVALFLWEKHGGKNGNDLSMQTWETQERKVVEVAYEGFIQSIAKHIDVDMQNNISLK
jgi:hypothetical protein